VPELGSDHTPLVACLFYDARWIDSKVEMLRAAVANEYRIRMLSSPTTHETVSLLFRGFRNENSRQRTVRLLITEEILTKMYSYLYQSSHGRDGLRASVVF
jgi:hypothetical protein